MNYTEQVLEYNRQMKEALTLIFNELNQGQQKKLLKNEEIEKLLIKYKVIGGGSES